MTNYIWKRMILLPLCAVVVLGLNALPANAQATRTWVSGVGDDANPCSRTAPCKTLPGAISKTSAGGEINILDPGGFGAVTITKAITIQAVGEEGGVLVAGTNGITINAGASDAVNLVGLDIDLVPTGGSTAGVSVLNAGFVHIHNCIIRGFPTGINVAPTSNPVYVLVTDTVFDQNATGALYSSASTTNKATGTLDHVTIFGTGPGNGGIGVSVVGAGATTVLNNSTVVRNQTGLNVSGGNLYSFGNNRVITNQTNGTANQSATFE